MQVAPFFSLQDSKLGPTNGPFNFIFPRFFLITIAVVLRSSFKNGFGLHPFLESISDVIRIHRNSLPSLTPIQGDPKFLNITKNVDQQKYFIFNELYTAKGFRKIHLELASLAGELQILHCVFFPDPTFNIPIFGIDVVSVSSNITAAIVDLSPVSNNLPVKLRSQLDVINMPLFIEKRELPEWGTIFSDYVHFIRPNGEDEEIKFKNLVNEYLNILVSYASSLTQDLPTSTLAIDRKDCQHLYCLKQKENDKTRSVLAKLFSPEWADSYIDNVLFDSP